MIKSRRRAAPRRETTSNDRAGAARARAMALDLRMEELAAFDESLWREAGGLFAGLDEAGRGPLAGPVVAAAVVLPPGARLEGVDDSKALSPEQRQAARLEIERAALGIGIGIAGPRLIDSRNILQATLLAARRAVEGLDCPVRLLMTDYLKLEGVGLPVRWEAQADQKSLSVAAASIIAKTTRDRMMIAYSQDYPGYGFERNKGYGCPEHLKGLERLGPSTLHRMSFAGVSLFTEQARPSLSFDRLRALREEGQAEAFRREALSLLGRSDWPLVECERRQVRQWLGAER